MQQLRNATSYRAIFGELGAGDAKGQKAKLRAVFVSLARAVHPDHNHGVDGEAFMFLSKARDGAEAAIDAGSYDAPFPPGTLVDASATGTPTELTSKLGVYRLLPHPFRTGDFSLLYVGALRRTASALSESVLVKIAIQPTSNPWLEREAATLRRFATDTDFSSLHAVVPSLIESFTIVGAGNQHYRVNVMPYDTASYISVAQVIAAYPGGLPPEHAAWIARRVLAQPLVALRAKLVHAAIVPDHILIEPLTHEPKHIGWAHALPHDRATRLTQIIDRAADYYPPEVFKHERMGHRGDLFMAGAVAIKLFGGNTKKHSLPSTVPMSVARVLWRCVEQKVADRYPDAAQALSEFTEAVRKEWGRVYRPLHMPVH